MMSPSHFVRALRLAGLACLLGATGACALVGSKAETTVDAPSGAALTGEKEKLAKFDKHRKRLKRTYADVLAEPQAGPHADLVEQMLRKARQELKS